MRDKDGYVYAFTGLRGDAKQLYSDIISKQEKRVKLIQALSADDQSAHVNQADLVIWACGYQTNKIPIIDITNKQIKLS